MKTGRPVRAAWLAANSLGFHAAHAQAVPRDVERPDHAVDAGHPVGKADLDEDVRGQTGRGGRGEFGHGSLHGQVIGGHAVISSRSRRFAVSSAVRKIARPRWTWALTVPSGRPRATARSGYDRPSTCRRTTAAR